jgi:hypothetical protein
VQANTGLLCLWGLALFTWLVRYHPIGMSVVVFDDDVRQHIYWMARFQDPSLFRDDPITAFMSSPLFAPWGYQVLCRLGSSIMAPLYFTQVLSLVLVLLSLWVLDRLLYSITAEPANRFVAGLLFLFYHTHNTVHNVLGGFSRSFALPLLLLCVLFLQRRRFRSVLLMTVAAVLLYPPIILNTLALAGDDVLRRWWQDRRRGRLWFEIVLLLVCTIGAAVYLLAIYDVDRGLSGARVTLAEARQMPEFYPGGRSAFFHPNPLVYFLCGRSGIGVAHLSGFLLLIGLMGSVVGWKNLRIPAVVTSLVWTSLALFVLSHLLLFRLYLPSRYTFYTLSLAGIIVIGVNALSVWQVCKARYGRRVLPLSRPVKYGALAGLLVLYAVVQSTVIAKHDPRLVVLDQHDMEMLTFLRTLPKDSVVAGHPDDMDNVPVIAQRKVLANSETAFPYYLGYYTKMRQKVFDVLQAYYATDWQTLWSFVRRYQIDALVLRKEHFRLAARNTRLYYEPFESWLRASLPETSAFVLATPPKALTCYENDRYVVLCVSLIAAGHPPPLPEERIAK